MANLLSTPTLVESPFIIATIGDYTFGSYSKQQGRGNNLGVTFPNFMQSMNITKINGAVNTYNIQMVYGITQFDDPNLIDRVLSTVGGTRRIKLSYGDWNAPSFIFKDEEAIITKVTQSVDFSGSKITYNISCVSDSLALTSNLFNFPKQQAKPSDVIKRTLKNKAYGLQEVFKGMQDDTVINQLIKSNDQVVTIEAKTMINPLNYLNYLVSCMVNNADTGDATVKTSRYALSIKDDTNNEYGGTYFRVVEIPSPRSSTKPSEKNANNSNTDSFDTYDLDIGYPGDNLVTGFQIKNSESWSILYELANQNKTSQYVYRIGDNGAKQIINAPNVTTSRNLYRQTEALRSWWTNVTEYPIQATVTIKGLLRPSMLMTYVRINCYFFGNKYIASGLYIITKQEDTIDGNGYRTTLTLTRIGGDTL